MPYLVVADQRCSPIDRLATGTTSQEIFAFRLRLHRERKRLSIAEIASVTRVKQEFFESLERNDLSRWPRGLYARAWVRMYATLVGLDPVDTVEEFCRLFPHGDRRARETFREIAAIVAHPTAYREEPRENDRRRRGMPHADATPESTLTRAAHAFGMAIDALLLRLAPSPFQSR